ncbi:MAG: germination protein YpeB [Clostridia bacterium]|nr:germination protein YpeB [Clostridia bacterium]
MLEIIKKRRQFVILSTLLLLVTAFGIYQYKRANELAYFREIEYNRIFTELTEYVDDLEVSLLKGQVVSTPAQMARLAADLSGQASSAKANLSMLPIGGKELEKTSEFLSQVGEYAHCISDKMQRGEKLGAKEIQTMQELTKYADTLKNGLDEMLIGINEGRISFLDNASRVSGFFHGGKVAMESELLNLEEEFHNYPSLIYDGPFSQHLSRKTSVFAKGKPQITQKQAKQRAQKFTGEDEVTVSQINGKLPAYSINSADMTVEYTKQGGILLMLMKDRHIGEGRLSLSDAKKKAQLFLKDNGFNNMQESYYEKRDGSVVINYAYEQGGYTVFPDLVKVKVALDSGEVIGFESRGYIMNHKYRIIPAPKISEDDALLNINENLEILDTSMAVIPLDDGGEAPCYQIKGTVFKKHFLIYVNTQTGETEDVQILLESEGGTLAV